MSLTVGVRSSGGLAVLFHAENEIGRDQKAFDRLLNAVIEIAFARGRA